MPDPDGPLDGQDLRRLVREVLLDSLAAVPGAREALAAPAPDPEQVVALRDDDDLDAFVRRVATMCDDPGRRGDLRDGRLRFHLAAQPDEGGGGEGAAPAQVPVRRVERGAVTERQVREAARAGARLVAAAGTVITPLARDRARAMGVDIEKER